MLKFVSKVIICLFIVNTFVFSAELHDLQWENLLLRNSIEYLPENLKKELNSGVQYVETGFFYSIKNSNQEQVNISDVVNKIKKLKTNLSVKSVLNENDYNKIGATLGQIFHIFNIKDIYEEYYLQNPNTNAVGVELTDNIEVYISSKTDSINFFAELINENNKSSSPGLFVRLNTEITNVLSALCLYIFSDYTDNIVVLNSNFNKIYPGEKLTVNLGIKTKNKCQCFLYYISPKKRGFVTSNYEIVDTFTPFAVENNKIEIKEVFNNIVSGDLIPGRYSFYTVLTDDNLNLLTDVFSISIDVKDFSEISLEILTFEPYLMIYKDENINLGEKLIYPFDMVFLGVVEDDKATEDNETTYSKLIPGHYSHSLMYFGRDERGIPYAVEMTTSFEGKKYDLHYVRLLDRVDDIFDTENLDLSIITKKLSKYSNTDAKRFKEKYLGKIIKTKDKLFGRIERDIEQYYPYQLEFFWSGSLTDFSVYLIDDGLENGASCSDYWTNLLEDYANVCIKGVRADSYEITDYFLNDPKGIKAEIPEKFNPFPIKLYIKDLIPMGYYLVNPEPHVFKCDNSRETGIVLPYKLHDATEYFEDIPLYLN